MDGLGGGAPQRHGDALRGRLELVNVHRGVAGVRLASSMNFFTNSMSVEYQRRGWGKIITGVKSTRRPRFEAPIEMPLPSQLDLHCLK